MTIHVVFDFSPQLQKILTSYLNQQENITVATIQEFKANILAKIAQMQQASADEHDEVLAVIDALKVQIGGMVDNDVVEEVDAAFDAALAGIQNIHTAPAAVAARKK